MGLFVQVRIGTDLPCRKCGTPMPDGQWQSKDADDCYLQTIPISEVRRFYAMCNRCQAWNGYRRKEHYEPHYLVGDWDQEPDR